jgi:hypothetical protein
MSSTDAYFPLSELADPEQLPFGDFLDDILKHLWITVFSYDETANEGVIGLLVDQDVSFTIPGVPAVTLALGSTPESVNARIRVRLTQDRGASIALPLTLRVGADVLQPVQPTSQEPDLSKKTLDISLGTVEVGFDADGNFTLDLPTGLTLPRCLIGSTGVIVSATNVQWLTPNSPNSTVPGFTGLHFDQATIEVTSLPIDPGKISMDNVYLGTGGFSGQVSWSDASVKYDVANGFTGLIAGDLFGFSGALSKVELTFEQSALTGCDVQGNVFVRYIDKVIGLTLGFDGHGALTAIAQTPTCQISDPKKRAVAGPVGYIITAEVDAFTLDVSRIEFHAGGDAPASLSLSGQAKLKLDAFPLPAVVFEGLRIDTNGHVAVDGGWLDVDTAKSSALSGFPFQITKIGFGAEEDGHRWIGLNGGIKLADGLPVGASVEGLRVRWTPGGSVDFSLDGIGLELSVPGTFSFAGKVAFFKTSEAAGFRGALKLSLDSLSVSVDAGLMIGRTTDGVTFFYLFLDLELPFGIPLFSTGAAIYGFAGLVATNLNPARADDEDWYYGYYRRPPVGVTDPTKWGIKRGGFAIGLGTTLGTMEDTGFSFSAKVLLILVLPGPQILLQGKGKFVDKKPDQKDPSAEGNFEALLVLDFPSKLFQANIAVAFKISTLLEVAGGLSVAFTWSDMPPPDLWRVYLGEKTPAERRIHATLFKLLQGDSWLMINRPGGASQLPDRQGDFEIGGSIGVSFKYDFSVAKAWLDAGMIGAAAISWNPQQFTGSMEMKGSAGVSVLGVSIVAVLDAVATLKAPNPWFLTVDIEVGIKIDLILTKFEFHAKLPFELGDKNSPLPGPVTGLVVLSADHAKADEGKPLDQAIVPPDVRPTIVFARPVQDRARFGSPGRDDTPVDDLGLIQVSYQLRHVALMAKTANGLQIVGAAGEAMIAGNTATFAGLSGAAALPDLTGVNLTVFAPGQMPLGPLPITSSTGGTATFSGICAGGSILVSPVCAAAFDNDSNCDGRRRIVRRLRADTWTDAGEPGSIPRRQPERRHHELVGAGCRRAVGPRANRCCAAADRRGHALRSGAERSRRPVGAERRSRERYRLFNATASLGAHAVRVLPSQRRDDHRRARRVSAGVCLRSGSNRRADVHRVRGRRRRSARPGHVHHRGPRRAAGGTCERNADRRGRGEADRSRRRQRRRTREGRLLVRSTGRLRLGHRRPAGSGRDHGARQRRRSRHRDARSQDSEISVHGRRRSRGDYGNPRQRV